MRQILRTSLFAKPAVWSMLVFAALGCDGHLEKAKQCYKIGDYHRAKRLFDRVIDGNPESFEARYGYALVLQEISLSRKSVARDGVGDWLEVVNAYEICSRLGEAPSLRINHATSLFHLAHKLYLENKFKDALPYLDLARGIAPEDKYVLNLTGIVLYNLRRFADAQETFEFLIALDPGFVSGYLNLANVLWEDGQVDAALAAWKQALNLSPGNEAIIERIESAIRKIAE